MAFSYKETKKKRADEFAKLNTRMAAMSNPGFTDPEANTYWEPVVDKAGNGFAIIRWMPTPPQDAEKDEENAMPIVQWWSHGFKGPGGWYIELSRTTLNEKDPCGEMNTEYWNSGDAKKKEFVQGKPKTASEKAVPGSKRKENFCSNIMVVSHPARQEDEGKVFRYKYGKKLFEKLNEARNPKVITDESFNAFDLEEGADFILVIGNNEGNYRGYEASK